VKHILRFVMILMATVALATSVLPESIEQLTHLSSVVVEAQAVQSWAQWNEAHTLIFTYTRFSVSRTLKGQPQGSVTVRQLGGTLGNIRQKVSGVRAWRTGEQTVLFLRPSEAQDGTLAVTGLMQGNFLLHRANDGSVTVSNGVPEASRYDTRANSFSEFHGSSLTLANLELRVLKAAKQ